RLASARTWATLAACRCCRSTPERRKPWVIVPMTSAQPTVVIVEDDVAMRQATERVLSVRGIATRSFGNAEAALADADLAHARCLIVDVRLPGMSGIELCECMA